MQADARLVEDVQDADQAAADLPGQADALGLAAGEGRGGAVERQVVQADVEQEAEPAAHLLQHFAGDGPLHRREALLRAPPVSGSSQAARSPTGMAHDFDQRLAADADGPGLRVEALALAGRAAHHAHVLFELHPPRPGGRLLEAAQQLRDDAFPLAAVLPDAAAALLPLEGDVPVAGAVEQQVAVLRRQVLPRRLQVDAERLGHALVDVPPPAAHAAQRADERDRAVGESSATGRG